MVNVKDQLIKDFIPVLKKLGISVDLLSFDHPALFEHGDYSTNIALRVQSAKHIEHRTENLEQVNDPISLANAIVNEFRSAGIPDYVAKIDVVAPGFINIFFTPEILTAQVEGILKEKEKFGGNQTLKGQKILLEHTSPNPQTTIMLGHLRNNFLGMAVANLFVLSGAEVVRDCVVNDRGTHLCRAIYGYLVFGQKSGKLSKKGILNYKEFSDEEILKETEKVNWKELLEIWMSDKDEWWMPEDLKLKPDHANLIWYVLGSKAYKGSDQVKIQVGEILRAWEEEDLPAGRQVKNVRKIWKQILSWSEKGYAETYKRIGSLHDNVWYESDHYQQGKDMVEEGLKKKVFKESEGAIVTDLEKYGLTDTVLQKTDGTALYLTQDLALTKLKVLKFKADKYIWDVGMEQDLYFKQLFAVCDQLGIAKKDKLSHLSYSLINFKGGGKMATRQGNVVMADEILDLLKSRALEIIKNSNQELRGKLTVRQLDSLAEAIAVGAAKYSLLKYARETTIFFDIDESLSLEGDSGPYLQYTYARTKSVLAKQITNNKEQRTKDKTGFDSKFSVQNSQLNSEEIFLLRIIYKFPEVVESAMRNYSPNLIAGFLFDLAQAYNNFYNKHRIIGGEIGIEGSEEFRVKLTSATGQIIKNGLALLGIEVPERM